MPEYDAVKDSGERQRFETGAQRDIQAGKGRYDLLPAHALHRLARHFENGAVKYGDNNWRKGIPTNRYMDSGMRHLVNYMLGDRSEDHLAAAAWNIMCLIETEYMIEQGQIPEGLDVYNADALQ